ncbi:UpxY family transcription antiterminator [Lutimonas sp.]|uniref:UpxY family transcription antiterminator n=1 Tax=Lutimonas sp. TaxID=1872403 RepID=UPI003C78DD8F
MNLSKNEGKPNWYAIFTKPRSEKKVYQRMIDHNIEAFLPMVKTVRQWSDRKKTVEVPLISSYIFVHMEEKDLYKTLPIQGTVNVLKHLGKPAKIRAVEIENLRILSGTSENHQIENCINVLSGDDVEVINGPFMGLIATCLREGQNHRVVVKIDSLGSCFNVNIPLSFLRKIEKKETVKV